LNGRKMDLDPWRSRFLSWTLTAASRSLLLRDRLLQVTRRLRRHDAQEDFFIASGNRRLACAYLPGGERSAAVLFCHGIGETVAHWSAVQALFHDHGIGSLVFNYSGYGKSTGPLRADYFGPRGTAAAGRAGRAGLSPWIFLGKRHRCAGRSSASSGVEGTLLVRSL
jgi:hypothetical protein